MISVAFDTTLGPARLLPNREYVTVVFPMSLTVGDMDAVSVAWDRMADVEYLADRFADSRVAVFRAIVEQLGTMSRNQAVYEELLP